MYKCYAIFLVKYGGFGETNFMCFQNYSFKRGHWGDGSVGKTTSSFAEEDFGSQNPHQADHNPL